MGISAPGEHADSYTFAPDLNTPNRMERIASLLAQRGHSDDLAGIGFNRCPQCKQDSKVMLTGKGAKLLCRFCDSNQIERHEAAFNAEKAKTLSGRDVTENGDRLPYSLQ